MNLPASTLTLLAIVFGLLTLGSITGWVLSRVVKHEKRLKTVANLQSRMTSWWIMSGVFITATLVGGIATVTMFGLASFFAFREFVTLNPTRRADQIPLFAAFFVVIPLQYYWVGIQWYPVFSIFIPVYVFLAIPAIIAIAGDTVNYLGRTSKIQWGLMTCVYFVSHTPALLFLPINNFTRNADLLFVFVLLVELNDVAQYVFGSLFGSHKITPTVSPNKTWEGFVGGVLATMVVGVLLTPFTPFLWWQSASLALAVACMGFLGDIVMSAVKRDIGVKDYSSLIPGHGGALDRMDSLSFAAPLFFHLVRYFFTV